MTRARPPNRRAAETFEVKFRTPGSGSLQTFLVSMGAASDEPREVFAQGTGNTKPASLMADMLRDASIVVSIALQHGVPLDALTGAVTREDNGDPSSPIGAVLDSMERGT